MAVALARLCCMARPLRIEYAGAIEHVMSGGNVRRRIFRDDADRRNRLDGLEDTVVRYGWDRASRCLWKARSSWLLMVGCSVARNWLTEFTEKWTHHGLLPQATPNDSSNRETRLETNYNK